VNIQPKIGFCSQKAKISRQIDAKKMPILHLNTFNISKTNIERGSVYVYIYATFNIESIHAIPFSCLQLNPGFSQPQYSHCTIPWLWLPRNYLGSTLIATSPKLYDVYSVGEEMME
jgi:hypothetical protein